ncbi:MAG: patatin-like phospholipase family protein [Pseudomonadota bacterium]
MTETDPFSAWRSRCAALMLLVTFGLSACTTVLVRSAVPEDAIDVAKPYGIESEGVLRLWGDFISPEQIEAITRFNQASEQRRLAEGQEVDRNRQFHGLALSGGGPDGAYGAGVLAGWTARGDRPVFDTVTGVSTGAIIALYAFLGSEYDDTLREIYTEYETDDLLTPAFFAGLTGGTALLDASGYRRLIERYIDDEIVQKLAEAHGTERFLLIGTTNIDASRPVVWNLTAIAASGHPMAKTLIHDVIQASSAIPAAFPPVLIPVEVDGKQYDEMHVDGGATQQVMLVSPQISLRELDDLLGREIERTMYVIINNKLTKPYDPVRPRVFSIAARAASSLIGGSGGGDLYRIFAITERDDAKLRVLAIPRDFDAVAEEPFDPVYMGALYDLGFEVGQDGDAWLPHPPDFREYGEPVQPIPGPGG